MEKRRLFFSFCLLSCVFALSFILFPTTKATAIEDKVVIYFFWGEGCPHCAQAKPFLEKLQQEYPLEVKSFEIYSNKENQQLFQKIAQAYGTSPLGVPMFFIGDQYIVGFDNESNIGQQIEDLVQNCLEIKCPSPEEILSKAATPSSTTTSTTKNNLSQSICIHYFVNDNCQQCENLKDFLESTAKKYQIDFQVYNVSENQDYQELYQQLQEFYGLSSGGFPIVFLGDTYLIGDESIRNNIDKVISRCQKEGCPCPVDIFEQTLKQIPQTSTFNPEKKDNIKISLLNKEIIISSQSSLLLLGIILGLIDGINPCMLSVLLFLLSYLLAIGSKKHAVKVGLVFALGAFITYLLFMVGILNLINLIGFIQKIKIIVAIISLAVGLIMLKDFFFYGKGLSLEIPKSVKPTLEKLVKRGTLPSALILAFLSSLVELPCTAGIPLVYITLLAQQNVSSLPYLILYNAFFIVPLLVIVLITAFAWAKIEKIESWRLNARRYMRLVAGLILIFLAVALFKGWM